MKGRRFGKLSMILAASLSVAFGYIPYQPPLPGDSPYGNPNATTGSTRASNLVQWAQQMTTQVAKIFQQVTYKDFSREDKVAFLTDDDSNSDTPQTPLFHFSSKHGDESWLQD